MQTAFARERGKHMDTIACAAVKDAKGWTKHMLELPEAYTIAKQLRDTVVGKTIQSVITLQSPHKFAFFTGDPAAYAAQLQHRQMMDARAWGGHVELQIDDMRLVLSEGVNLRWLAPGTPAQSKHQLWIALDDGSALVATVQMYGGFSLYHKGEVENDYYLVAVEKPSPLTDAFDYPYFCSIVSAAGKKTSAKALLATGQRIPGLGNGCLQDILFYAGINPQTRLEALDETAIQGLYQSIKKTLADMTTKGGRNIETDLFGNAGDYQTQLSAKSNKVCPRCGEGIVRKAYLGGNVYFCPACQPI